MMNKPEQIVIIGGGKSINEGIAKGLWNKLEGKYTIGCNYAFRYFEPTIITFCDYKFWKAHFNEFKQHPLMISRTEAMITSAKNLHLFPNSNTYNGRESFKEGIYVYYLTGIWAVTLAIQLLQGKGEIFLLGYDVTSDYDEAGKLDNNFHGDKTLEQRMIYDCKVSEVNKYFEVFKIEKEVKIYNVNPNSKLFVFDKINYDDFFVKIKNQNNDKDELINYSKTIIERSLNG